MRMKMRGCGSRMHGHTEDDFMGSHFGVRRPLRFLAWKLDLDDKQVAEVAKILDQLKTDRAQAAVDDRRTLTDFADAFSGEHFGEDLARAGVERRKSSAEHLGQSVFSALASIHSVLKPEQRERFAYLVRTGALSL
jgi:Spy/CpxP family protein refolding chaperone